MVWEQLANCSRFQNWMCIIALCYADISVKNLGILKTNLAFMKFI